MLFGRGQISTLTAVTDPTKQIRKMRLTPAKKNKKSLERGYGGITFLQKGFPPIKFTYNTAAL